MAKIGEDEKYLGQPSEFGSPQGMKYGEFVVFPLGFTQFFPQINLLANVNFWFEIQMILKKLI